MDMASGTPYDPYEITFTYDVKWTRSDKDWSKRWDIFMNAPNVEIQWRGNIHR